MPTWDSLHPLLVHFPIGLIITGWAFDLLALKFPNTSLAHAGWWNLLAGVFTSAAAAATGFIADSLMGHLSLPFNPLTTHGFLALLAAVGLLFIAGIRVKRKIVRYPGFSRLLVLHTVLVLLLIYSAHLGAHLANRI